MPPEGKQRITKVFNSLKPLQPPESPSSTGQRDYAEIWIVEHRMTAERKATSRLTTATWVLVITTAVLAFATFVLAYGMAVPQCG